jgi:hypothetical protein
MYGLGLVLSRAGLSWIAGFAMNNMSNNINRGALCTSHSIREVQYVTIERWVKTTGIVGAFKVRVDIYSAHHGSTTLHRSTTTTLLNQSIPI